MPSSPFLKDISLSVEATTFSFPLRTVGAEGLVAPRPGTATAGPSADRSPFLLRRFHGDEQNPLLRCWCDAGFMTTGDSWPLVLYGPSGVGKSALAETLASRLDRNGKRIPGDDFRRQFLAAVATKSMKSFRERMKSHRLLLLDDLNPGEEEAALTRELVQLLDFYRDTGRPVIVTTARAPWTAGQGSPALRSRLSEGLTLEVRRPGMAARRAIVNEILHHLKLEVDRHDLEWLVNSLPSTAPLIRHGLSRIAVAATHPQAADRPRLTRRELGQCLPADHSAMNDWLVRQIVKLVARQFGQRISDITGKSRRQEVVRARSVAMYLSRNLLSVTFRETGRLIGGRDPSTVRHAYRQIARSIPVDSALSEAIDNVIARFAWVRENKLAQQEGLSDGEDNLFVQ